MFIIENFVLCEMSQQKNVTVHCSVGLIVAAVMNYVRGVNIFLRA